MTGGVSLVSARPGDQTGAVSDAAETHRQIAGTFTERVLAVEDGAWDNPAPVDGWRTRDVVRHLVEWLPAFLAGGSDITLASGPSPDDDPVEAWRVHSESVQEVLDDPVRSALPFTNPHTGDLPVGDAIDRFYTSDVFMHTWDLSRAAGIDETLDPDRCAMMLEGMLQYDELLRSSGQYGPRVEVPADADAQTKLLAFIGRNP